MSEKLYKGIASALKLDADEWIASLKNDGGEWLAEDDVAARIAETLTERVTAATANSRKSGQREINDQIRKFVKGAGFENTENLQGKELLASYDEWRTTSFDPGEGGKKPAEMTEDELVKLPMFKGLIAKRLSEAEKAVNEARAEVETVRKQATQARVSDVLKPWLSKTLEEANVVLEVTGQGVSKQSRIDAIYRQLDLSRISLDKEGNPFMLDDDGESPKTDTFGKNFDLKKHVVADIAAPLYGIHAQNPKLGGANPPANGGAAPSAYKPTMTFASQQDYDRYKMSEVDPALRLEATQSWQHQQAAAGN